MSGKRALIVIDMQNDYLWEKRKSKFAYDTEKLTAAVNRSIREYSENGDDVIYIAQIFPNLPTNRLLIGFSIKGTEGAELYKGVDRVSELYFEKNLPNTFTAKKFREFMARQQYSEVAVCGVDECGCVGATAKGAAKTGLKVSLLTASTGTRFSGKKLQRMREQLNKLGVIYK
ncbi:MAG: cysteine hydrolase [Ruminococcus sp.]|nr:cysteine hydrolase [Ruminococcus sp.]